MPIHDWTKAPAGIFHDFHHAWIEDIKRTLNAGILPDDYYALAEQYAAGFGPDVLTLQSPVGNGATAANPGSPASAGPTLLLSPPRMQFVGETDMAFYRRKQNVIAVRHVSGDEVVAMVEIVSPGNKSSRHAMRAFVDKAAQLLDQQIHLLIIDLHPPTSRDPNGVHAAVWSEIADEQYTLPGDTPLTLASYDASLEVKAYVQHLAVGDVLPDTPLFLTPGAHVEVPLETTYQSAWSALPARWQKVVQP